MLFVVEQYAQMFIYQILPKKLMNPLISYIHKEKLRGFSDGLITEKMKSSGYTEEEITTAFKEFYGKEHYYKFIDRIVEEETKHKWLFLVLAVFAVILVTAMMVLSIVSFDWNTLLSLSSKEETVAVEPHSEADCRIFSHRDKERCLLKVAASLDDTTFCVNMTSKVMQYECKTSVWNKNYCNFLILTNQSMVGC